MARKVPADVLAAALRLERRGISAPNYSSESRRIRKLTGYFPYQLVAQMKKRLKGVR